jgi:hypothetical protein
MRKRKIAWTLLHRNARISSGAGLGESRRVAIV